MGRTASPQSVVETVVKLGGSLLSTPDLLDVALRTIQACADERRLLIVPGGGAFADAVRAADRRLGLSNDAAHWMAILAIDQSAHLVAQRLEDGGLAWSSREISGLLGKGHIPVLAPSQWCREADPLPHTWDVTSDSIAAWVAGRVGARHLVLVKPPEAERQPQDRVVDRYFARTLPKDVTCAIVTANELETLPAALVGGS